MNRPAFYTLLSLPATAMGFALCVQISALSWILSTKYNLKIDEVGWVWMSGPLAGIFGQLLAGLLSDRIWFLGGRRRPLIIFGGIIAAAMIFCLPHLDIISTALGISDIMLVALSVALLLDLAINIGFNPTRALIADLTPPGEARTLGYTIMQSISGLFGVLAYLIGAFAGNMTLIYLGVGLVLIFSLIPPFFLPEPRHLSPAQPDQTTPGTAPQRTNIRQLLPIYLAHAFTWLGVQTMFVYLYAYAQQQLSATTPEELGRIIGIAFAIMNTVGFILPALVLQPLARKYGRVRIHTLSIATMAIAYFLILTVSGNLIGIYSIMALIGIGWAAVVSLPFAIMTEHVAPPQMGLYMGIFNLSVVFPQLIVSAFFGSWFRDSPDLSIIFIICGTSLAISALLWALLVREPKS